MSNPFDLGGLGALMEGVQQQVTQMQADAAKVQVEGQAGGGLVKVVATGAMEIVSVSISDEAMDDREMLEDLVTAGVNAALANARSAMGQQMGSLASSMGLPPGLMPDLG